MLRGYWRRRFHRSHWLGRDLISLAIRDGLSLAVRGILKLGYLDDKMLLGLRRAFPLQVLGIVLARVSLIQLMPVNAPNDIEHRDLCLEGWLLLLL